MPERGEGGGNVSNGGIVKKIGKSAGRNLGNKRAVGKKAA